MRGFHCSSGRRMFLALFHFCHSQNFLSSNQGYVRTDDMIGVDAEGVRTTDKQVEPNAYICKMINGRDFLKICRIFSCSYSLLTLLGLYPHASDITSNIFIRVSLQYNNEFVADRPLMKYKWSVFGLSIWRKVQVENGLDFIRKRMSIRKYITRRSPHSKPNQTNITYDAKWR